MNYFFKFILILIILSIVAGICYAIGHAVIDGNILEYTSIGTPIAYTIGLALLFYFAFVAIRAIIKLPKKF